MSLYETQLLNYTHLLYSWVTQLLVRCNPCSFRFSFQFMIEGIYQYLATHKPSKPWCTSSADFLHTPIARTNAMGTSKARNQLRFPLILERIPRSMRHFNGEEIRRTDPICGDGWLQGHRLGIPSRMGADLWWSRPITKLRMQIPFRGGSTR